MASTLQLPRPTWFVGCGNMGGAILDGWRTGGHRPWRRHRDPAERHAGRGRADGDQRSPRPGAPPQAGRARVQAAEARRGRAASCAAVLSAKTVIVSLLAGVEATSLRQRFPGAGAIVRAMPNLPVAVRRGVTGLYSADADDAGASSSSTTCSRRSASRCGWPTKRSSPRSASVAGAGPAYVARFIAALAKAGEKRGLTDEIAATIALRDRARHRLDGGERPARAWSRSPGASRAPTARPKPGLRCSTATMCSTS